MCEIANNLKNVHRRIKQAAQRSGRRAEAIQLIAVGKTHPPERIRMAYSCGIACFGENRVQEAEAKIEELAELDIQWHLIGPLQTNKVKKAVRLFTMMQTLDRPKLCHAFEREAAAQSTIIPCLIQVNIGEEAQKAGVYPDQLEAFAQMAAQCRGVQCRGLMAIPPFREDPEDVRPYFRKMKQLSDAVQPILAAQHEAWHLSMGMTHDFEVAIEEGATMIRIGTAIFGKRIVD